MTDISESADAQRLLKTYRRTIFQSHHFVVCAPDKTCFRKNRLWNASLGAGRFELYQVCGMPIQSHTGTKYFDLRSALHGYYNITRTRHRLVYLVVLASALRMCFYWHGRSGLCSCPVACWTSAAIEHVWRCSSDCYPGAYIVYLVSYSSCRQVIPVHDKLTTSNVNGKYRHAIELFSSWGRNINSRTRTMPQK